jgi:hypothetical protein
VSHPKFLPGLRVLFVLQVLGMVAELLLVVVRPHIGLHHGSRFTDDGTVVSTAVSAAYTLYGAVLMHRGNIQGALRVLYRAALITLLFTQVFVFIRYEWSGLLGFVAQALVLGALRLALHSGAHEVAAPAP